MRILHFGVSDNLGGIENYVHDLFHFAKDKNIKFDFIQYGSKKIAFADEYLKNGCYIHKVVRRNDNYFRNIRQLNSIFKKNNYDILHVHLNTLSYIAPIIIANRHKCKVIVHSRSSKSNNSVFNILFHKFNFFRLRRLNVHRIAVSKEAGLWLFGKNNYSVINNGIYVNKFQFDSAVRCKMRSDLGCSNRFIIGNVGAFSFAKNHKFIIDIFYEIKLLSHDALLVLIGDGVLKNDIIRYASSKLSKSDYIILESQVNISDYYALFDVFLFPSLYEGFPNVVLEAQVSGLPVVLSDTITREVIKTNNCYRLSLTENCSNWAKKICSIKIMTEERAKYLNNPELIRSSRTEANSKIIEKYKEVIKSC